MAILNFSNEYNSTFLTHNKINVDKPKKHSEIDNHQLTVKTEQSMPTTRLRYFQANKIQYVAL